MAKIEFVPVSQLRDILDAIGQASIDDIEDQGLVRLGNTLEAKAVELAPVRTGNLESSTQIVTGRRGGIMYVQLRFNAPYSAQVHELPEEARGPRTRAKPGNEYGPAGPKFLERPLRGFQQRLGKELGEFLQELWGRRSRQRRGRGRRR